MIIGYGFRDDHINQILEDAIDRGLKVFINDLNGITAGDAASRVAAEVSDTNRSGYSEN